MIHLIQKYLLSSLSVVLLLISFPQLSEAQDSGTFITSNNTEAEIVPRYPKNDAEYHITTQENSVTLLLTNSAIYLQFTDDYLEKIAEEIRGKNESDDSDHLGAVLRSAISSGVQTLLDRAITVPLNEIEEIYYENGRLVIINRDGEDMFKEAEVDDVLIMEDFSRRDARRFVAESEKRMI
ncbi:hypothetical protein [Rhodohalobacter sp.]|uniref:hypothetical protein n=1 Tax=Rhodohalobacter sp. TaxID=1974210 RepID=UPI002ACD56F2|nr:hypothetical protein [Rhodohalobacter sp.]MDZ7757894.1 hypothetical protein [Rhodohalobacter sp.]